MTQIYASFQPHLLISSHLPCSSSKTSFIPSFARWYATEHPTAPPPHTTTLASLGSCLLESKRGPKCSQRLAIGLRNKLLFCLQQFIIFTWTTDTKLCTKVWLEVVELSVEPRFRDRSKPNFYLTLRIIFTISTVKIIIRKVIF